MERAPYAVEASVHRVDGWSTVRLPFEPRGWLADYRNELREALRAMQPTSSGVLEAEYASPDTAFADLENVLLYNVGTGSYSHLATEGLVCRRATSVDALHRVSYLAAESIQWPDPAGTVLAEATLLDPVRPNTAVSWWKDFRSNMRAQSSTEYRGQIAVTVDFGARWASRGLVSSTKELLDGLVAALHVHDGSQEEHITRALSHLGDGPALWRLLNDPTAAILGQRRLLRPHGQGVAINPADELCAAFRFGRCSHDASVTAIVYGMEGLVPVAGRAVRLGPSPPA